MKKLFITYSIINSIFFINAFFGTRKDAWILFISIFMITSILLVIIIKLYEKKLTKHSNIPENIKKSFNENKQQEDAKIYHKKELLTDCEKQFMERLKTIFSNKYIIQPQVPLRMIISKDGEEFGRYANELHRYIDFGIFTNDYQLLALIELNDNSHKTKKRYERNLKLQNICSQANIPLITFWTQENQTNENIRHFIEKEIGNAKRKTN